MSAEMKLPPLRERRGQTAVTHDPVTNEETRLVIEDEIHRTQTGCPEKDIVLQRLRYEGSAVIEYRLGYNIIGKRPQRKGKWVWGQYATFLPGCDLQAIVDEAKRRNWIV